MAGYVARDEAEIEANLKASKECHGNTVCHAIFWDEIEPEEGKFDFSSIDTVIRSCPEIRLKINLFMVCCLEECCNGLCPGVDEGRPAAFQEGDLSYR